MATKSNGRGPQAPRTSRGRGAAARLAGQLGRQAGELTDQGLTKAAQLIDARKDQAVDQLDTMVGIVREFADGAGEKFGGVAGGAAHRGGDALESMARTLRERGVRDLVVGSRSLISRHPGAAIGAVSVLAFIAGRIAKCGLDDRSNAIMQATPKEQSA